MERVEQSQGLYQSDTRGVNAKKKDTKKANHGIWFCFNLFVLLRKLFNTLPFWCQKDQPCHSTFIVGAFSTCIRRFEVHKYIIHSLRYNSTPL